MQKLIKTLKQQPFVVMSGIVIGLMLVNLYVWARTGGATPMLFIQVVLLAAMIPLILKMSRSKTCKTSKK